jgi:hypothetical protein
MKKVILLFALYVATLVSINHLALVLLMYFMLFLTMIFMEVNNNMKERLGR